MLRTSGGFAGWSDEQFLLMPYARLVQATRVAIDEAQRSTKNDLVNAAFIGYQFAASQGALKSGMNFQKYLEGMGLGDKTARGSIKREKEKAKETAARIAELFNAAPVVKETSE